MIRKAGLLLGAAVVVLPAAAALAQQAENSGFYVGAGGAYNFKPDADVKGDVDGKIEYGSGWGATVTAGYAFGGPRLELEGGYRENKGDDCPVAGCDKGTMTNWSAMVNALYDFNTGTPITPYAGVGVGAARTKVKDVDSKTVFAYQGILGVAYDVTPELKAFADYRYFATEDMKGTTDGGLDVEVENENHTGMIGVRYMFGAPRPAEPEMVRPAPPPPPPPRISDTPAPAPEPVVRSYLVFFEFDKTALTPDARRIVETAARSAASVDVTRIDVTGHTDRAGSAAYNTKLSRRRAETVRNELIRNGVKADDIAIYAKGENELLVPTSDGVREAQNRRVEIVIQ
ncbi:OOP family OmpA-OmpF porin [Constrictibacter sp. MBR-5]|jgi:outer membrane protein OmpA-like peptidoglycan-associated protein/outer membrane protein W|uniref:OmpA family protein n=1 Tax=Constrictibacter sp. MBR-5 TaxID=3156467 RepID=UPI00339B4F3D